MSRCAKTEAIRDISIYLDVFIGFHNDVAAGELVILVQDEDEDDEDDVAAAATIDDDIDNPDDTADVDGR